MSCILYGPPEGDPLSKPLRTISPIFSVHKLAQYGAKTQDIVLGSQKR